MYKEKDEEVPESVMKLHNFREKYFEELEDELEEDELEEDEEIKEDEEEKKQFVSQESLEDAFLSK